MAEDLPFTRENRPWLTQDCIESMNIQWMDCLSKIPPAAREALKEWAAVKVEMRICHDREDVMTACHDWGERWVQRQIDKGVIS